MLLKGNTKKYVDKNKVGASYFITCACFLLIACNVGVFVFTPKMIAPINHCTVQCHNHSLDAACTPAHQ